MKASGEGLEAIDQCLSEECNRYDQDGEENNGKQDGRKPASATKQLLQLAVTWVASNSDRQPPGDHGDEGAQNKKASDEKQST